MRSVSFEEVMNYDKRNLEVYNDLLKRYISKGITPFIGAGVSVCAGFMTWTGFLSYEYKEHLEGEIQPSDSLDAASNICSAIGNAFFRKDIIKSFGGDYTELDWNAKLQHIYDFEAAGVLPKLFHDVIVTTNFDRLLEHLYPTVVCSHPGHDGQLNRAVQIGIPMILKLHGCVSDPDSIILTRETYLKAYPTHGHKTQVIRALEKILTSTTVLFLGCSLQEDSTVKHWTKIISQPKGKNIEHYAIINCTQNERKSKRRDLSNKNIQSILYDSSINHDALLVILEQLYKDTNGGTPLNNLKPRNEYFTGRSENIMLLRENFRGEMSRTQIISGLGGVGKTQTALEFAHRYLGEYSDGVWWLNADNNFDILNDCRKILVVAKAINSDYVSSLEHDELILIWNNWLNDHKHRLLIFDNVECAETVEKYIPENFQGHVLLTTRDANFNGKSTLGLKTMSESEAVAFLLKRTGRDSLTDAQDGVYEVARRLGYLPLALEQAAAYILNVDLPFSTYLSRLDKYGLDPLCMDFSKPDSNYYKKIVNTTWQVSFDLIALKNPPVCSLLDIFAYTDSNNIPLDVLKEHRTWLPIELAQLLENDLEIDACIVILRQFSFVERNRHDDHLISIHRLVQEVIRDTLSRDSESTFLSNCFSLFYNALPKEDTYDASHSSRILFERVAAHATMATYHYRTKYENSSDAKLKIAQMLELIGTGYMETAHYDIAMLQYQSALNLHLSIQNDTTLDVAKIYNDIGFVYYRQDNFDAAQQWLKKAVNIREDVLGFEHSDTLHTYTTLACVFERKGDYEEALNLNYKVLETREKFYGLEHADTGTSYNNIGLVYARQGNYQKSLELYYKSLVVSEKVQGLDHIDTATSYNNISVAYTSLKEYPQALIWAQKALVIRKKALGDNHPDTAKTMNNIAVIYYHEKNFSAASDILKDVYKIYETVFGRNHPDTALTSHNLAAVYLAMGEVENSLEWNKIALDIRESILNQNHTDTAVTYNNRGDIYMHLNDAKNGLNWFVKSYRIFNAFEIAGVSHPFFEVVKFNTKKAFNLCYPDESYETWLQNQF